MTFRPRPAIARIAVATVLTACGSSVPKPAAPLTPPTRPCEELSPEKPCRSATEIEAWLRHPELEIVGAAKTHKGKQRARILTLSVPTEQGPVVFRAKWREFATTTIFNHPRIELAAYAVQKLYLEPHEYVVPVASGHCFELSQYRERVTRTAKPSFPGVSCVFGILSYWLEHVESVEDSRLLEDAHGNLLDEHLFWENEAYRRSLANLNLLTYLIDHDDSHENQFLVSESRKSPRLYSVDNSMAFETAKNPTLKQHWSDLRVPALPRDKIERLSALDFEDIRRLSVIEQYENRAGRLLHVAPSPRSKKLNFGFRWAKGDLEVGLNRKEIDNLWWRIRSLVQLSRHRQVPMF
jgi:hypothetical protein